MADDLDDTMMAIVMLADTKLPDDNVLERAVLARMPSASFSSGVQAQGNVTMLFLEPETICSIMRIDAPAPISPQDSSFISAWYWPDAWEVLKGHNAHMLVSVTGELDTRKKAVLLGQLISAVIESAPSSVGVHCANSDALLPAKAIPTIVARHDNNVSVSLMVSIKLIRNERSVFSKKRRKISAFTQGLSAFELMEIEIDAFKGELSALNAMLLDLAAYLISAGPVIEDGDSIGPDENTKIVVRHELSRYMPGQKVYKLHT